MQFALNYSSQAAGLLFDGRIQLNRFKCPDWQDMIAEARKLLPAYVHFGLVAGRGGLEHTDWDAVDRLLNETDTPYVNLHLASVVGDFPDIAADTITEVQRQCLIEQMHEDVGLVVRRFGADRVIVENIPYLHSPDAILGERLLPVCVDPAVICAVVEAADCGFLFDISHAVISADTLGVDAKAYIEALPLHRLRELHVTGIAPLNGRLEDHMPMTDADWTMFDWVMDKIESGAAAEPWMVAFEYGGIGEIFSWRSESVVIAMQVPKLYQRVHGIEI